MQSSFLTQVSRYVTKVVCFLAKKIWYQNHSEIHYLFVWCHNTLLEMNKHLFRLKTFAPKKFRHQNLFVQGLKFTSGELLLLSFPRKTFVRNQSSRGSIVCGGLDTVGHFFCKRSFLRIHPCEIKQTLVSEFESGAKQI